MKKLGALCGFLLLFAQAVNAQTTPFNRGVNLSGWFQADSAEEIQFNRYSRKDFEHIKNLGADVIRLPINLHHMTNGEPDYTLDTTFLRYLDKVIDWTEELEIHLIIDNHTFDPATSTDPNIGPILEKVWLQMSAHLKNRTDLIYYEVMNEPHGISDEAWNTIQQSVVATIRTVDTQHTIIIGGAGWNSYLNLAAMPVYDDDNLIYTFHFYDPFLFTHQGASWVTPSMVPLAGMPFPYDANRMPAMPTSFQNTWLNDLYDDYPIHGTIERVKESLDIAIQFRSDRRVPLFLGELGVFMPNSDNEDRVFWYQTVREYLEENNIAWTAWDYHGGFGVFEDGSSGQFDHDLNLPLLEALGFVEPPQTPLIKQTDSVGFVIYSDNIAENIYKSGSSSGTLNFASANQPFDGNYAIHWAGASKYNSIGFDFQPDRDLSFLKERQYVLDLYVRGDTPGVALDVRFMDSDTEDPNDHPWRMQARIDDTRTSWNGQWQHLQIPLSEFTEQGAWENGEWFDPQGDFNWTTVDRFEIVTDDGDLQGINIWFDNIQLSNASSAPLSPVKNTAINGLFYDPQAPGHGFDFNYHQAGTTIFYYGHTANGERLWLISEAYNGSFPFNQAVDLKFYEIVEGQFGAPVQPESYWGTVAISLVNCNSGLASFDGVDGRIEMNLVRLAGIPGVSCLVPE